VIGLAATAVRQASRLAAAFQQAQQTPADSVVVESPLPGGIAPVVRFLLNAVPPWVQVGGVVLAAVVGAVVLVQLVRRRHAVRGWLVTRSRGAKIALASVALVLLAGVGTMGAATWNYTQHSNDFCTGCHVMHPAFAEFSADENKHAELSCHDCHQQPLMASARQLYLWVTERPEEIGEHAKVPNEICATCHVTSDTARWQRIAATAGHRVHLESDSSALNELQCVTCHGVEVHRFRPVNETCGQSQCHKTSETDIVLGKMAEQTVRHCTSCHPFTAEVPALATTDSARGTLVPGRTECLGCHEMRRVLEDFDPSRDPHAGKCGTCHNPHEQKTPAEARGSCATAGCHGDWRTVDFHVGASHRDVGSGCLTCHLPHRARVDASDCQGCHVSVRERSRLRPPLPFDTSAALRRVSTLPHAPAAAEAPARAAQPEGRHRLRRSGPSAPLDEEDTAAVPGEPSIAAPLRPSRSPPVLPDSFSHARHAKLACLVCHQTSSRRSPLTFEPPRGCTICHHQAPADTKCGSCHQRAEYAPPKPSTVTVSVPGRPPAPRSVAFLHESHASRSCMECHVTSVTLAPSPAVCQDCHVEHHAAGRSCSSCHPVAVPKEGHPSMEAAHQRCDACHARATVALLIPTRSFCATCHTPQATRHYDTKECTSCHFLAQPPEYRTKLVSSPPR
jgi:hypothetical protein